MKSYVIDEISSSDMVKIRDYLENATQKSEIKDIFWARLPEDLLNGTQYHHKDCMPHVFAIELGRDWVKFEFLVRSLVTISCQCQGYGTSQQIAFIMEYADRMITELGVRI